MDLLNSLETMAHVANQARSMRLDVHKYKASTPIPPTQLNKLIALLSAIESLVLVSLSLGSIFSSVERPYSNRQVCYRLKYCATNN